MKYLRSQAAREFPSIVKIMEGDGVVFSEVDEVSGHSNENIVYATCQFCPAEGFSVKINKSRNVWRCRSCGASGGPVQYVKMLQVVEWREAADWLAEMVDKEERENEER